MFTPSHCRVIEIRKFEFVKKTKFLSLYFNPTNVRSTKNSDLPQQPNFIFEMQIVQIFCFYDTGLPTKNET